MKNPSWDRAANHAWWSDTGVLAAGRAHLVIEQQHRRSWLGEFVSQNATRKKNGAFFIVAPCLEYWGREREIFLGLKEECVEKYVYNQMFSLRTRIYPVSGNVFGYIRDHRKPVLCWIYGIKTNDIVIFDWWSWCGCKRESYWST